MRMPIDVNGERFLNMTESADYLGITRQTLKKKIAEWKMTPYVAEVGRAKYLSEAELKKHLGSQARHATEHGAIDRRTAWKST